MPSQSDPESLSKKVFGPISREWSIYLLSLPVLGVLWMLVQHEPVVLLTQNVFLIASIVGIVLYSMVHKKSGNNNLAYSFAAVAVLIGAYAAGANLGFLPGSAEIAEYAAYTAIAVIIGFVVYGFKTHNSDEFGRTVVLMILILSTVVFWALFEQSAGSMTLYADRVVDREAGGITFTAAQFGSLNAMFIFLTGDSIRGIVDVVVEEESRALDAGEVRARHHPGRPRFRRSGDGRRVPECRGPGCHDLVDSCLPVAHNR